MNPNGPLRVHLVSFYILRSYIIVRPLHDLKEDFTDFSTYLHLIGYISGLQQVVRGPPVVPEGVPGGPQLNDGEWVTNWTLIGI